jgi:RNA polymerase sigma factor (sigma-70 family)
VSPIHFKRLSDERLGSRLASGEAAAFDELYRRYSNRLAAYGSHLLGDAGSGDDVAQATMLKAYAALREGRVPDRMKPWLYRIAHNVAIDLVVRRHELPSDDLPESPAIDREPFAGALVEALATLPDRQRRVYVMREVHGLRIDETAAELGLTAGQVEQSLFSARNRLAEQLVFGDRLNCVTVQRLAAGPLDSSERRALKTHLRTCHSCRQTTGHGRAFTLLPGGVGLEWLRGLGAGLIGAGAPAAAKVGAVLATATIVGGGTVAVEQTSRHNSHRGELRIVHTTPVTGAAHQPSPIATAVQVAAVAAPVRPLAVGEHKDSRDTGRRPESSTGEHEAQRVAERVSRTSNDGPAETNSEHTTTTTSREASSDTAPTGSREHSGTSSETQRAETQRAETTQPAETQSVEPQEPSEQTTATSAADATTSSEVTTPEVPGISPD